MSERHDDPLAHRRDKTYLAAHDVPRRQSAFQRGFNRKGLIAEDRQTKKAAVAVVAEEYRRIAEEDRADA